MRRPNPLPSASAKRALFALLVALAVACDSHAPPARAPAPSTTAASAPTTAPGAIPVPNLSKLDPAVQAQLRTQAATLSATRERADVADADLGRTYGEMAMLYHAYELRDAAAACYQDAETLDARTFRWPYYLGQLHRETGEPEQAVDAFERALRLEASNVPALVGLAEIHLAQNRQAQAASWFRRALRADPACAPARAGLGRIAASNGEPSEALREFEAVLRLQPEASSIHYAIAMAYRAMGELDKARFHLQQRGQADVRLDDPLTSALRGLRIGVRHHEQQGVASGKAGNLTDALSELREAVRADSASASVRVNLGTALALAGDPEAAMEQYREAVRLEPGLIRAHYNLAVVQAERGLLGPALERFGVALRGDPNHAGAHLGLADVLLRLGRLESAAEHYARVIEIDPTQPATRVRQAMTLSGLGRHAEARTRIEEARTALPRSMTIALAMARLLAAAPDEAVRDGARALQLALACHKVRDSIENAEVVAMAYAELRQFEPARAWQRRALEAARQTNQTEAMPRLENGLHAYERDQPCRSPWPTRDATVMQPQNP